MTEKRGPKKGGGPEVEDRHAGQYAQGNGKGHTRQNPKQAVPQGDAEFILPRQKHTMP